MFIDLSPACRRRDAIMPVDGGPDHRSSIRRTRFRGATSIPTPSRSSTACTSTTTSRISWAAVCAICCSDDGRRISTLEHRPIRIKSRSCSATAGSSDGDSVSPMSSSVPRRSRSRHSGVRSIRRRSARSSTPSIEAAPEHRARSIRIRARSRRSRKARTWPGRRAHDRMIHRDNTFGTPEEDAFRRDFTINALFYDIATFSIIDYVNGLEDLRRG